MNSFGGSYVVVVFLWFGLCYKILLTKQRDISSYHLYAEKHPCCRHTYGYRKECFLDWLLLSGEEV